MTTTHATDHEHHERPGLPRAAVVVVVAVVLAAALLVAPTAGARVRPATQSPGAAATLPDPAASEAEFVARINQLRAARGLGALTVDPELTAQARQWAATMAGQGHIFHSGDLSAGISANWQKLGENVGVGGAVGPLFDAFVASPTHYENLVDPAYTRVGVGVVNSGDRMYTAHRFMALAPAAPPPTSPPTTAAPTTVAPTTAPPTTAPPTTLPPTTTTAVAAASHKLGPIDRIAELVALPGADGAPPEANEVAGST